MMGKTEFIPYFLFDCGERKKNVWDLLKIFTIFSFSLIFSCNQIIENFAFHPIFSSPFSFSSVLSPIKHGVKGHCHEEKKRKEKVGPYLARG